MSWVSEKIKKVGKGAKKLVTDPKKWAENAGRSLGEGAKMAAPFLPPGLREIASIGGSIAAGGNMKDHAISGISAYAGSKMGGREMGQSIGGKLGMGGGAINLGAANAAGNAATNSVMASTSGIGSGGVGAASRLGGMGGLSSAVPMSKGVQIASNGKANVMGGGGWQDALKTVGKWGMNNSDLILGGLSAYEGYKKGKKSDDLMNRALNDPRLNAQRPDLSETFGYENAYTIPKVGRRVG